MKKDQLILKYQVLISDNLRKIDTSVVGVILLLQRENKLYQQFVDDLQAMDISIPPAIMPQFAEVDKAAKDYANAHGGGEYGLVANSFKKGIIWLIDEITKKIK